MCQHNNTCAESSVYALAEVTVLLLLLLQHLLKLCALMLLGKFLYKVCSAFIFF